jgi:pseudouridine-5'-phosphate glycosidase
VTVPPPEADALPAEEVEPVIAEAVDEAAALGLRSGEVTPFLLRRLGALTGGRTLGTNLALLERNARVAARIAVALVRR